MRDFHGNQHRGDPLEISGRGNLIDWSSLPVWVWIGLGGLAVLVLAIGGRML